MKLGRWYIFNMSKNLNSAKKISFEHVKADRLVQAVIDKTELKIMGGYFVKKK